MDSSTQMTPYLITLRASIVALTVVAPACVLDTKLVGNPGGSSTSSDPTASDTASDASSGDPTTSDAITTSGDDPTVTTSDNDPSTGSGSDTVTGDATTGTGTDTGETAGDACEPPYDAYELPYGTNDDQTWNEPIDEACTVTAVDPLPVGFELHMDCPKHAEMHGEVMVGVVAEPVPDVPQVGDILDIYYQSQIDDDFIDTPRPSMLFLHSEGELLYASTNGFFIDPNDAAIAAAHYAPLTVDIEPGPCPLVENPDAGDGDGFTCAREALALIHFKIGEEAPLVLGMGMSGDLPSGGVNYGLLVLLAKWGEDCVEVDLERFSVTIARQSAP